MEEALDSPLSLLNLINYSSSTKAYQSKLTQRDGLPLGILGFAITELLNENKQTEIPIEDLMYSKNSRVAPGLVFRLSETALLTKLEQLIHYIPTSRTLSTLSRIGNSLNGEDTQRARPERETNDGWKAYCYFWRISPLKNGRILTVMVLTSNLPNTHAVCLICVVCRLHVKGGQPETRTLTSSC